ncbi:toxin-antitoxin system HicB family antitoxin [Corynebacterium poyangense]|uniref:toxin-antitoxin system HicB family antitoxin n=1 Tax=Corynebacterium poyangense TaxID=2684405 RepID=UPI001CCF495B|nr:toxin-antitoxin system HicB family antitoxin [Corynebacterium poyangense]
MGSRNRTSSSLHRRLAIAAKSEEISLSTVNIDHDPIHRKSCDFPFSRLNT